MQLNVRSAVGERGDFGAAGISGEVGEMGAGGGAELVELNPKLTNVHMLETT